MNLEVLNRQKGISRRRFVKLAGVSALGVASLGNLNFKTKGISIVVDPSDQTAGSQPSQWAINELEKSLVSEGIDVFKCGKISQARKDDLIIVAAGGDSPVAGQLLKDAKAEIPPVTEALGIVPVKSDGKQILLASGYDVRGLVYALLELTDRVKYSTEPLDSLNIQKPIIEKPANEIRSINRHTGKLAFV